MYSNESEGAKQDIYDDLKLKKKLWSPWFMQKYLSAARVNIAKKMTGRDRRMCVAAREDLL